MNQVLILLLVTLVQSQSDGVVLPNDRFQDSQLEAWDTTDTSYSVDVIKDYYPNSQKTYRKRLVTSDAFTRRSALDKNFMRFGRGGEAIQKYCRGGHSDGKFSFHRFGRGLKDNFIRFGKAGDNFIRFGRGGGKDGFIRFGKALPNDFFRTGKSSKENFIRFGKADDNLVKLGRENTGEYYQDFFSSEEPLQRADESSNAQNDFLRFGKSRKNKTHFLRFGKRNAEQVDADKFSQDLDVSKEVKRKRRDAEEKSSTGSSKSKIKRSTRFFEISSEDFSKRISPIFEGLKKNLESLRHSRLPPFFSIYSNFPKGSDFYGLKTKKN